MVNFISYANEFTLLLNILINDSSIHAKWLNTLSFLENCGARLIAECEHPTKVSREILKHAAEEFRHSYFLKCQIARISYPLTDYRSDRILGTWSTTHYLKKLSLEISRFLKTRQLPLKEGAYLLTTYAIERRAQELYPLYQAALRQKNLPVSVKAILKEEENHLAEIEEKLKNYPERDLCTAYACKIESALCKKWLQALSVSLHTPHQFFYPRSEGHDQDSKDQSVIS